jgi:hypothetical protein
MSRAIFSLETNELTIEEEGPLPPPMSAEDIRAARNQLLAQCDWTQLPDATVDKDAWLVYRQALRDITEQTGFPETVEWPQKPLT